MADTQRLGRHRQVPSGRLRAPGRSHRTRLTATITNAGVAMFVAAWRRIVTLFRRLGARNVAWLWTVNTIHPQSGVPFPRPWRPGSSYVNWVGIDGYYLDSSSLFASVFGPTIADACVLTRDPILIAETSAGPAAGPAYEECRSVRRDSPLWPAWLRVVRLLQQSGLATQQSHCRRRVSPRRRDYRRPAS